MSLTASSFQASDTGSLTTWAPMVSPGCQMLNTAPPASMHTAIRPAVITSNGPASTDPPAALTASAALSAFVTFTYVVHASGALGSIAGPAAATLLPFCWKIVYPPPPGGSNESHPNSAL